MCNCSCLFETIHSFVDLDVHIALRVNKIVEVVFLDCFRGKEAEVDSHEFRFFEGVVFEVEVFDIAGCKSGSWCGYDAVEKGFYCR